MTATDLVALPADPSALDQYADPAEFVVLACERAKTWLAEALNHGSIEDIVELKSQAEAIRTYTAQKQLGRDAELSAAEIVRRAERCIGLAIRKGQAAGEIRKAERHGLHDANSMSPTEAAGEAVATVSAFYDITDGVDNATFDESLSEAKAEGNLSRANVIRKVKSKSTATPERTIDKWAEAARLAADGFSSRQIAKRIGVTDETVRKQCRERGIDIPADKVVGRTRRIDPDAYMQRVVEEATALTDGVSDAIDFGELDGDHLASWVSSLSDAIRSLTTLKRRLEKELTR